MELKKKEPMLFADMDIGVWFCWKGIPYKNIGQQGVPGDSHNAVSLYGENEFIPSGSKVRPYDEVAQRVLSSAK